MKKILQTTFILLGIIRLLVSPSLVKADSFSCAGGSSVTFETPINYDTDRETYSITLHNTSSSHSYRATITNLGYATHSDNVQGGGSGRDITLTFSGGWISSWFAASSNTVNLEVFQVVTGIDTQICPPQVTRSHKIVIQKNRDCEIVVEQNDITNPSCVTDVDDISVGAYDMIVDGELYSGDVEIKITGDGANNQEDGSVRNGVLDPVNLGEFAIGDHRIVIELPTEGNICTDEDFTVDNDASCDEESQEEEEEWDGTTNICSSIPDFANRDKCDTCSNSNGVWTGFGCIKFNPADFVTQFLQIAMGLGGGAAFLLLIYGAFLFTTSSGDPKAAENAQGVISGAIVGLLMIIFSVVILNFFGVSILKLPGF